MKTLAISLIGLDWVYFLYVYAMTIRYLLSGWRLMRHVKQNEPEIWISLGRPTFLPWPFGHPNPFQHLAAQIRFFFWFLRGGLGATMSETMSLVAKTKVLFRHVLWNYVSILIITAGVISLAWRFIPIDD